MASVDSKYLLNPGPKAAAMHKKAAVTTDSAIVTESVLKVLQSGGNAADAAITGALVQAAVEPYMTNHAGLVTCLYYEAKTGRIHQLDSLGAHPSGVSPFRPVPATHEPYGNAPSAIIPGFMPGMMALFKRFATKPWRELCLPAVEWAERGHPVSTFEYGSNVFAEKFITYFPEGRQFFQPNGMFANVGEVFIPSGLAETLRGVAEHGPDFMISGPWAADFVEKANEMGWKIHLEHMSETPPRWLKPIRHPHHEYEVVSLAPPQAQGLFVGVVLGVLKHLGVRSMRPGSSEYYWAMGNALRLGTRHWEFAQDENIYGVPTDEVLDDGYHLHLAKMIRKARPKVDLSEHIALSEGFVGGADIMSTYAGGGGKPVLGRSELRQPSGSCEFSVVDSEGNWIQIMNTLQGSGIPGMVIGGVPMMGSHATFGFLQSSMDATLVKGAKERCVIGNTMVLKDGRPVLALGSPGNVHCTVPQVLTQLLDFKLDPVGAIDAPRMLPMTESRTITVEDRFDEGVIDGLYKLGIRVNVVAGYDHRMGSFSVIARDEGTSRYAAFADPRRCGVADGIG